MLKSNFCSNVQVVWRCLLSHPLRFLQVNYHLSRLHDLSMSPDSDGPPYDMISQMLRMSLSRIPSRRVLRCAPKGLDLYEGLSLLLKEPCLVFYPVRLFSCNVDVQLLQQRFVQVAWRCLVFHLLRSLPAGYRLHSVYTICSLPDSRDTLNLAEVVANSIPRCQ